MRELNLIAMIDLSHRNTMVNVTAFLKKKKKKSDVIRKVCVSLSKVCQK